MLDLILGASSGGIFGAILALGKHGIEIFQEKKKADASLALLAEQNKHELLMADKHAALIEIEAKNALTLAQVNTRGEIDVAAYGAMAASYDADKATYSDAKQSKWMVGVDFVRGITRPALTLIFSLSLILMTAWLWINVPASVSGNEKFLAETFYKLIESIIFLATSSCGWWFAQRSVMTK